MPVPYIHPVYGSIQSGGTGGASLCQATDRVWCRIQLKIRIPYLSRCRWDTILGHGHRRVVTYGHG